MQALATADQDFEREVRAALHARLIELTADGRPALPRVADQEERKIRRRLTDARRRAENRAARGIASRRDAS